MKEVVNKYIERFGAATILVFDMFDELSDEEITRMGYVNGLMLIKKGIVTPQQIIIEESNDNLMMKLVLAGDNSKQEDFIYRNILIGLKCFKKDHSYIGMSVERDVL
tara:strand:- start:557 stop:877 length:321 start_codon:yes stop_codon:yes gene_type:complete